MTSSALAGSGGEVRPSSATTKIMRLSTPGAGRTAVTEFGEPLKPLDISLYAL
jgi:hypothetical protein